MSRASPLLWVSAFAALLAVAMPAADAQTASRSDILITHVTVTDVEGGKFIADQTIAIRNGKIAYVGPDARQWRRGRRIIDGRDLIALPGFVDTHTHLWQHVARGAAPDSSLQEWAAIVYRMAHNAQPGDVRTITHAAAGQALLNGITSVADFASINFSDYALPETIAALRANHIGGAVVWWRPAEFLPWQEQDREIAALRAMGGDELSLWVGFGPLSFMPIPLVYDGVMTARRNGLRMTEHSMENLREARDLVDAVDKYRSAHSLSPADQALLAGVGAGKALPSVDAVAAMSRTRDDLLGNADWQKPLSAVERQALGALPAFDPPSPLGLLEAWGALDGFLAIHSVWPRADDIALYQRHGAAVSHNPESNMYLSSGVAPLRAYRAANVPVTLGTDGAASNDRISMFDAMRTAWLLQRASTLQAEISRPLDAWFYLRAATINGAVALGLGQRTGSIAVGKEADLQLIDRNGLSVAPAGDATLASRLVTSGEARDVRFVVADGAVMVEDGKLADGSDRQRATDLSRIAAALQDRQVHGKEWIEEIKAEPGLRRFRVVKTADTLKLMVRNPSSRPVTVSFAFSGTLFGRRTAMTMHPDSLARYPANGFPKFATQAAVLQPSQALTIEKAAASPTYRVTGAGVTMTRDGPAAEQVLILIK